MQGDAENDEKWLLVAPAQESHTVSDPPEGVVEMGESSTREEPAAEAAAAMQELRWRSPPPPPEAAAATEEAAAAEEEAASEAAAARTDDVLHGLGEDLYQLQSEVADVETRRSTTSGTILYGGKRIAAWCRTQKVLCSWILEISCVPLCHLIILLDFRAGNPKPQNPKQMEKRTVLSVLI